MTRSRHNAASSLVAVDVFAGCGGLSLGLQRTEHIDVALAVDSWEPAVRTYQQNFSHTVLQQDLTYVRHATWAAQGVHPDLIAGGPPCQDFSSAGTRTEKDKANLTLSFAQLVTAVRPEFFLMENVDRARLSHTYTKTRRHFARHGYGLSEVVVDASLCGVPQRRRRLFILGRADSSNGWADEQLHAMESTTRTTMRNYFGSELTFDHYYRHPRNYNRRGVFSVDEAAPTVRGVSRPVPPGYRQHALDTADPTTVQPLSSFWRSRVQTFPADFTWTGNRSAVDQQIGNAVPVDLAQRVGEALLTAAGHSQVSRSAA